MKSRKKLVICGVLLTVAAGLLIWLLPDRTRIKRITIVQNEPGSQLEKVFSEAPHEPERYTMGGCTEYPGGTPNDYRYFQISTEISSNKRPVNQSIVVSSFGSYADRWLYADKALGNNTPFILVVLYAKGLTDEQVKEAISQLQLYYCYSVHNTPKEIAFTVPVSF